MSIGRNPQERWRGRISERVATNAAELRRLDAEKIDADQAREIARALDAQRDQAQLGRGAQLLLVGTFVATAAQMLHGWVS